MKMLPLSMDASHASVPASWVERVTRPPVPIFPISSKVMVCTLRKIAERRSRVNEVVIRVVRR